MTLSIAESRRDDCVLRYDADVGSRRSNLKISGSVAVRRQLRRRVTYSIFVHFAYSTRSRAFALRSILELRKSDLPHNGLRLSDMSQTHQDRRRHRLRQRHLSWMRHRALSPRVLLMNRSLKKMSLPQKSDSASWEMEPPSSKAPCSTTTALVLLSAAA